MYIYEEIKPSLFTEEGVAGLLIIRDSVQVHLESSGAFKASKVITGDSWMALAALDFMVEKGELREVEHDCLAQNRVFIAG